MSKISTLPWLGTAVLSGLAWGALPLWMDTPLARLEALALIQTLNVELLSSTSATLTLERWCRDHALADTPVIWAHRIDRAGEDQSGPQKGAWAKVLVQNQEGGQAGEDWFEGEEDGGVGGGEVLLGPALNGEGGGGG